MEWDCVEFDLTRGWEHRVVISSTNTTYGQGVCPWAPATLRGRTFLPSALHFCNYGKYWTFPRISKDFTPMKIHQIPPPLALTATAGFPSACPLLSRPLARTVREKKRGESDIAGKEGGGIG